jgi:6-phosphogluconolactonase (cycloisomerase 2 family)
VDATTPQVAVARNGNAVAVWVLTDHENGHVLASRYTARDQHWATPVPIDAGTASASSPQVASDALGNALIVWSESGGIQARSYAPDGTLGAITPLQSVSGSSASPQIAFGPDGTAFAVWHQSNAARSQVWANRFTPASGGQWTGAVPIEEKAGDALFPQLAVDAGGNAIVVWQQATGSHTDIWANRYVGGWSTAAARAIENNDGNAFAPQVALDASGNARAIWFEFDSDASPARNRVWSSRYTVNNDQWGAAAPVEDTPGSATEPRVALDSTGNAVAVWMQVGTRTGSGTPVINIWSSRAATGSDTWDAPVLLEKDDSGDARAPSIAMDANGNALAAWHQIRPPAGSPPPPPVFNIWAARYTPGATLNGSWAPAELLQPFTTNADSVDARIVFDTSGTAIAVWSEFVAISTVRHFDIAFNRYAKPGAFGTVAYVPNGHALINYNSAGPSLGWAGSYDPGAGIVYESMAIHPQLQVAYVLEAGGIDYFHIEPSSGALTRLGGIGANVTPSDIVLEPQGKFLYVTSGGGVSTYTINQTSGMPLQTSDISVSFPGKPDIDPSSRFLYLPVSGAIAILAIDATNGKLTDTGRRLTGNPTAIRIAPSGKFAYVANFDANTITPYAIDAVSGNLTAIGSALATGTHPYRIAVDPREEFVYVANRASGDVSAYKIDPSTGALSAIAGSWLPAGTSPDDIRVNPNGLFVYVSNFSSKDVAIYGIDPVTGALTRRSVVATSPLNNSSPVFIRLLPVLESPPCPPPPGSGFAPRPNFIVCGGNGSF